MIPSAGSRYSDAQRMELRAVVNLAGDAISHFWPMRTFIHHNPLHGLERHAFHEAVREGQRHFGARGYPSCEVLREWVADGRVDPGQLTQALQPIAQDKDIRIGSRLLSHLEILTAILLHACPVPTTELESSLRELYPERDTLAALYERLRPLLSARPRRLSLEEETAALGVRYTLSQWCDQVLGTDFAARIDERLMHWCAAFLDEGQTTWPLPERTRGLYGAWKQLARYEMVVPVLGGTGWRETVASLPVSAEDAVLQSLEVLGLPQQTWPAYLSLHLAALPGWTSFIKWRAEQQAYPWQESHPADFVQYLAVRLVYERAFVGRAAAKLGLEGSQAAILTFMRRRADEYLLRRQYFMGALPAGAARDVRRLIRRWRPAPPEAWATLAASHEQALDAHQSELELRSVSWQLGTVVRALGAQVSDLLTMEGGDLALLLHWLEAFPESAHGRYWLEASERTYQHRLLTALDKGPRKGRPAREQRLTAQAVFCIDVRSELLRRHLEAVGGHETFGFAGFFGVPIRFRAFGAEHETLQCPVLIKPKHLIREIPRTYEASMVQRHRAGAELTHAGHALLEDLKENVITPYVMVEAIGWLFAAPFFGKTLLPELYARLSRRLTAWLAPPISTTLTVDKLSGEEAHEMLLAEQRAVVRKALRELLQLRSSKITPELVEQVRRQALADPEGSIEGLRALGLSGEEIDRFLGELRTRYRLRPQHADRRLDVITQTGFTSAEQARYVEAALRLMGLTESFARLVLLCSHGSRSENNPYESALDCGACGGNQGAANARLLSAMANRPAVRALLAERGIRIPSDTHFCPALHDTTRDEIALFDLEDVPPTHRKDLVRVIQDLDEAARLTAQERAARFPEVGRDLPPSQAVRLVRRRSVDWSQVRPEWGLSQNAAFIVGPRRLTQHLDLQGRVFLHSYEPGPDEDGRLLETILTAPLVVGQWINMEHYFSTVDQEVYGSGSKIYHNVVGRIGVMLGTQSDLRIGLPQQTVLKGDRPYHEPLRLLAVVNAPRERVMMLIKRNTILQRLFDGQWVHLVVLEPDEGRLYRYRMRGQWEPEEGVEA